MSTIQQVIDTGDTIMAHCFSGACHHSQALDMMALREKLGPDFVADHWNLTPLLRCTVCGSKKVGITLHQKSNEKYCGAPSTWGMEPPS